MNEKCIHVIDSISDEASGPSYSVPRLCEALAAQGSNVRLLTIGDSRGGSRLNFVGFKHEPYRADFLNFPLLGRLRFSRALKSALTRDADNTAIVHSHGLWRMPNVYSASVAIRAGSQIVLSPRGMLGGPALEFSALQKKLFWKLAQGSAACAASCLHATSQQEYEDIRAFGLKAPIAIIPNGIDVPSAAPKQWSNDGNRTLLYLGRVHPKKGLDQLIAAWGLVKDQHLDWRLDIVGPIDSDYAKDIQSRLAAGADPRVRLMGPLYGEDKSEAYQRAEIFVLPTLNENFGMTVAEALAQGTPVISTKGAPWVDLVTHDCGWWVDQGAEALAAAMNEAMSMTGQQLAAMGEAGRAWMRRDFAWSAIATSMQSVYDWLTSQGERPSCVVID